MNPVTPSFVAATKVFARIGLLSFGGPAAQIALMHKELVADRPWIGSEKWSTALGFCMALPGPEAMQLATYAGWRLHGWRGGVAAGLLFVLPGAAVVAALAAIFVAWGQTPALSAVFFGIQAAVIAIVAQALGRMAAKAAHGVAALALAALAFFALFVFDLPFPIVVLAAALFGLWAFAPPAAQPAPSPPVAGRSRALETLALWLAIWWVPILALLAFDPRLFDIGVFFSKLAVVTFGGAYAVLAYMAQEVVENFGWLSAQDMATGLGLAETTPGPLILVTEFVGFLAAYQAHSTLAFGLAGAAVALWATFAPCFLWIFLGAPFLDRLAGRPRIDAALRGVSAAIVGVIANLSLWFALHVLFERVDVVTAGPVTTHLPDPATFDAGAAAIAALSGLALFGLRWGTPAILALAATLGLSIGLGL